MNVLVLNAGSGSQKVSLFHLEAKMPDEPFEPIWQALIESTSPNQSETQISLRIKRVGQGDHQEILSTDLTFPERIECMLKALWDGDLAVVAQPSEIDAVGHRVVHGGVDFEAAVVIDQKVESTIDRLAAFAPLHNPVNLEGIQTSRRLLGSKAQQVAVFDTSFHRTLAREARVYPGPYEWFLKGIQRYGFHGTSFRWAAERAAHLLGRRNDPDLKLVICHLGGGCSLAATIGAKSVDTTMGFTPLDGIAMCTRPGALDPGILLFLLRENPDVEGLEKILNKESGLKGLSGLPGDTRIILQEMKKGNAQAQLAMDVFIRRLRSGIGQMIASLRGIPDALVFTDAISEDEPYVRAKACEGFEFLGANLDLGKNMAPAPDTDIATPESKVRILLVKSREDWQIARECHRLLSSSAAAT